MASFEDGRLDPADSALIRTEDRCLAALVTPLTTVASWIGAHDGLLAGAPAILL